ncbi:MAG: tetratricopeptide repeat protein, partial [Luteibaculum sp.]
MKSSRILLLSTIILCACSTKNKGFISRAYHNTTARYNGYFNARESIKEGFNEYKKTREEDFDKILPVFIVPNEDEASALFPNMNRAIEKTEKVITRHSMEIGGKEYCRWIDDNYLAKGIAHFYKREYKEATSTFSFIAKRYPEEKSKAYSLGWLALTHIENDQLNEASLVIPPLNKLSDLKRKANLFRQKVNAQYYIERENYEEALSAIGQAIGLERKRRNKIRLYYIKAQLHQRMDNSNEAIAAYRFVVKKSPDYDLAFNAGISQATAVKGSANSFSVKKDLEKLLKDDKNIEYHDQIYYALAEIAFTERDYDQAVYLLKESIKASIDNDRQKGKSFLRLAKYFYEEKLYQPASVFYDSTLNILPTEHPEYEEIKSTAKNLQELVVHLNKVDLNDSLLALANLPPKDLDKKLNEIRRNERERILREQREQELKAQLASKKASKSGNSSGSWYFYNNKTKEQGFKAFKETWGDRPLEDNWRRSSRGGFSSPAGEDEDLSESGPSESFGELAGLPSLKELRDPIPQ